MQHYPNNVGAKNSNNKRKKWSRVSLIFGEIPIGDISSFKCTPDPKKNELINQDCANIMLLK